MIKRYNQAVKELSKFEGEIAEAHKLDMEREERIKREKEARKLQKEADELKKKAAAAANKVQSPESKKSE